MADARGALVAYPVLAFIEAGQALTDLMAKRIDFPQQALLP